MIKNFTWKVALCFFLIAAFCGLEKVYAQQSAGNKDSLSVKVPVNIKQSNSFRLREGIFDIDPPNMVRTIEYDAVTNRYILYERVGNLLYRPPQYLTFSEYLQLKQREYERQYFQQLSDNYAYQSQQTGILYRK